MRRTSPGTRSPAARVTAAVTLVGALLTAGAPVLISASVLGVQFSHDYRDAVLADEPSLYWRLGERTLRTVHDASASGRAAGEYTNAAVGVAGAVKTDGDTAAEFTAGYARLRVGLGALPLGAQPRTLETWFRTTSSATQTLFGYGTNVVGKAFVVDVVPPFGVRFSGWSDDLTWSFDDPLNDGTWHHVVVRYDGVRGVTLTLDGTSQTKSLVNPLDTTLDDYGAYAGRRIDNQTPMYGALDEVALYPTRLSDARVAAHRALSGRTPPAAPAGVTVRNDGDNRVTVSWQRDDDPDMTGYVVTAYRDGVAQQATGAGRDASALTVTGLAGGVPYTFTVRGSNDQGLGDASAQSAEVTPAGAATTYVTRVLDDDPAAFWRLSEHSFGTAADSGGAGRSLHLAAGAVELGWPGAEQDTGDTATAATSGTAVFGRSVTGLPQGAAARTVEAWVRSASAAGGGVLAYGSPTANAAFEIAVTSAGDVTLSSGPDVLATFDTTGIADTRWHHLLMTYDGATGLRLYVDGTAPVTATLAAPLATAPNPQTGIRLGANLAGTNVYDGRVDDIAVYAGELTAARVGAHAVAGRGAPHGAVASAGDQTASVRWNPPEVGLDLTGYHVHESPTGQMYVVGAGTTALTVDGLTNGTTYRYRVSAVFGIGEGPLSAPSNAVVPRLNADANAVRYRVNTGGPAIAGTDPAWAADTRADPSEFLRGRTTTVLARTVTDTGDPSIPTGTPAEVFADERGDAAGGESMAYAFPVPDGRYEVRLYLTGATGGRFEVTVEESAARTLKPDEEATTPASGFVERFAVPVTDGFLDVAFARGTGDPAVAGIEVVDLPVQAVSAYADEVVADKPMSYWRLGEAGGTVTADQRGAHPGTVGGAVTFGASGPVDSSAAVLLDAAGQGNVQLGNAVTMNPQQYTVEAWFKTTTSGTATPQEIVAAGTDGYALRVLPNGTLQARVCEGAFGCVQDVVTTRTVTDGLWHHAVLTRDTSTAILYVDGTSAIRRTVFHAEYPGQRQVAIGEAGAQGTNFFTGGVDEVAIYDHALSAERVRAHFDAAAPAAPVTTPAIGRNDRGPLTKHAPVATGHAGYDVPIALTSTCAIGASCAARLYWRVTPADDDLVANVTGRHGDGWRRASLARGATTDIAGTGAVEWSGAIPGADVTSKGVDYFLEAEENARSSVVPGESGYTAGAPADAVAFGAYFHVETLTPPTAVHVPPPFGHSGQAVPLTLKVACATDDCAATLLYRTTGTVAGDGSVQATNGELLSTPNWPAIVMGQDGAPVPVDGEATVMTFTASIPAAAVDTRGVDYFFYVTDGATATWWPGTRYAGWYVPVHGMRTGYQHLTVLAPPNVVHVPVAQSAYRTAIPVSATATCAPLCTATLWYRTSISTAAFVSAPMAVTASPVAGSTSRVTLTGTIPGTVADTRGVDYFLGVDDGTTRGWWPGTTETAGYVAVPGQRVGYHHVRVLEPAHVTHVPPLTAPALAPFEVRAQVTCATELCQVKLHYRKAALSSPPVTTLPMTPVDAGTATPAGRLVTWRATIPAVDVTTSGLSYYVSVDDGYTTAYTPGTNNVGKIDVDHAGVVWHVEVGASLGSYVVHVLEPPHLFHAPVATSYYQQTIPVNASATCATVACVATLKWRVPGAAWKTATLAPTPGATLPAGGRLYDYTGAIPGTDVTTKGVDYQIAVDDSYVTDSSPVHHVTVLAPTAVLHAPVVTATQGQPLPVEVLVPCATSACTVTLYWRSTGAGLLSAPAWTATPMPARDGGTAVGAATTARVHAATIPGNAVTTAGIDYFVKASDGHTTAYSPGTSYAGTSAATVDGVQVHYHHVRVAEPVRMVHVPVVTAKVADPIEVVARVTCATTCLAVLGYRASPDTVGLLLDYVYGATAFREIVMSQRVVQSGTPSVIEVTATIPGAYVATNGVDYWLRVSDGKTTGYSPGTSYVSSAGSVDGTRAAWHHVTTSVNADGPVL